MDRRNFVRRIGLLGGTILAGSGLQQAWGKDIRDGKPAGGLFTFQIGNVDYYTYRYSFAKYPARTAQKLKEIIASGQYPLLREDYFDRMKAEASVVTCRVACSDEDGYKVSVQMLDALQTCFPETFAGAVLIGPQQQTSDNY